MPSGPRRKELAETPHVSVADEMSVIGAMLISEQAIEAAAAVCQAEDFHLGIHRRLFRIIRDLHHRGERADILSVPAALRRQEDHSLSGPECTEVVVRLAESVPTAADVKYYAGRVRTLANKRCQVQGIRDLLQFSIEAETDVSTVEKMEAVTADLRARLPANGGFPGGYTAPELLTLELPPLRWIVPDLLPAGLSVLAGKSKLGKSWLAYQVAVAVALGGMALGGVKVDPGRVLYLALEDPPGRLQARLLRILGDEAAPDRLHVYNQWPRMVEGGRRELERWFREYPDTRLVIIDTFAKVKSPTEKGANAYDEDYRAMGEVKSLADTHGAGILVLHHFNKTKPTEDWVDSISGSIAVSAAADSILGFYRSRTQGDAVLKISGRDIEDDTDKTLSWTAPGGPWTLGREAGERANSPLQQAILDLLASVSPKQLKAAEIGAGCGVTPEVARTVSWRLANRGLLTLSEGSFGLPEPPPGGI